MHAGRPTRPTRPNLRILAALVAVALLSALGAVTAPRASALGGVPRTFWVDAVHGSDANVCDAPIRPCRTIDLALILNSGIWGSTIELAPGTYEGQWDFTYSIAFEGLGATPDDVVIRPRPGTPGDVFYLEDALAGSHTHYSFTNLSVTGATRGGGIVGLGFLRLSRVHIHHNQGSNSTAGGVHFYPTGGALDIDHSIIDNNSGESGGGLATGGPTTITDSQIAHNAASPRGGGIVASGRFAMTRSAVFDNTASSDGSGIWFSDADADLVDTTIANNHISDTGFLGAVSGDHTVLRVLHSTISGNDGSLTGGGIGFYDMTGHSDVTLTASILAGNHTTRSDPDCTTHHAVFHDGGDNVIGDATGCDSFFTDRVAHSIVGSAGAAVDPQLRPLGSYGASMPTMPPASTASPAFGRAGGARCVSLLGDLDARGLQRFAAMRGVCDSGAADTQAMVPPSADFVDAYGTASGVSVTWEAPPGYMPQILNYRLHCEPACGDLQVDGATHAVLWQPVLVGRQYSFTVTAMSVFGLGATSRPTATVTAFAPPGPPRNVVATNNGTTVDLTWDPPLDTGGGVGYYAILCYPAVTVTDPTGTPVNCSPTDGPRPGLSLPMTTHLRLTNVPIGVPLQFGVLASNDVGTSWETRSNPVTVPFAPGVPTIAIDPADDTGPSATDGVTSTRVLYVSGTADANLTVTIKDRGAFAGVTVADATGHWHTTTATLADGSHVLSASTSRGPATTASAPLDVLVDGANPPPPAVFASVSYATATVTWSPVTSTAPVIGYFVTANPRHDQIWVPAGQPLTATFSGLNPASTYSFVVAALNLAGMPSAAGLSPDVTTAPLPAITAITPHQGTSAGGNRVTITGTDLRGVTQVWFGSALGTGIKLTAGATKLTVVAPPGSGVVDVRVVNPLGSSAIVAADRYTYLPPLVKSLSPKSGPVLTAVTITGARLGHVTAVQFGGLPSPSFTVVNSTTIVAYAPLGGTAGAVVDVTVRDAGATSALRASDRFTYTM